MPAAAPRWPAGERVPTRPRWTSTRGPSGAGSLESRRGEVPPGHRRLHKPSRGLARIAMDSSHLSSSQTSSGGSGHGSEGRTHLPRPHSKGLQSSVQQSDKLGSLRSRLRGQSPPGPAGSFPPPPATHPVTRMTMSPACPAWPLVLRVLHREEKDLGFITGRQESQKLKKNTLDSRSKERKSKGAHSWIPQGLQVPGRGE